MYQHGGRFEGSSLIDPPYNHFIIIVDHCCLARLLHRPRQAAQASQKYKFSSISKRQDGKHFLVRAGENVASCDGNCFRTGVFLKKVLYKASDLYSCCFKLIRCLFQLILL